MLCREEYLKHKASRIRGGGKRGLALDNSTSSSSRHCCCSSNSSSVHGYEKHSAYAQCTNNAKQKTPQESTMVEKVNLYKKERKEVGSFGFLILVGESCGLHN
jgi:hypothetical protein